MTVKPVSVNVVPVILFAMEIPFLEILTLENIPEYANTICVVVISEILNAVKFGNVICVIVNVFPVPDELFGVTTYV